MASKWRMCEIITLANAPCAHSPALICAATSPPIVESSRMPMYTSNSARSSGLSLSRRFSATAWMSLRTAASACRKARSSRRRFLLCLRCTAYRSAAGDTITAVPIPMPGAPGTPPMRAERRRDGCSSSGTSPVTMAWAITPASCADMVTRKASSLPRKCVRADMPLAAVPGRRCVTRIGSSPMSGRNWKFGCCSASSRFTGSSRSATRPTRPSPAASPSLPTCSWFRPSVARKM